MDWRPIAGDRVIVIESGIEGVVIWTKPQEWAAGVEHRAKGGGKTTLAYDVREIRPVASMADDQR